jgi:hypothetical protein
MNWSDFSNKFFGTGNPYVPKNKAGREEFLTSPEYQKIQEFKNNLADNQPDIIGPEYSGKFVVRVGKSLHKSLVEEAQNEGMSLNQLVLAKLAPPLYDKVRGQK